MAAGSQAFSGKDVPGVGCWGKASFLLPVHLFPIRTFPLQTQGIFLDRADSVIAWETGGLVWQKYKKHVINYHKAKESGHLAVPTLADCE